MADGYISQIKLPNNETYDFRDRNLKVYTGSCTTAAGTAIKDVTTDGEFTLAEGAVIFVRFTATNTVAAANLKLRINSTAENDAKPIKHQYNASEANLPGVGYIRANQTYMFYYDGDHWVMITNYNSNDNTLTRQQIDTTRTGKYSLLQSYYTIGTATNTTARTTYRSDNIYAEPSSGTIFATAFSGSGDSLTNLNGSNIASGTVAAARIDSAIARLTSPALTGTPTAPTAEDGTNTTQIATTAFVMSQFKYNDAMIYKGVVNADSNLPATHYQGWTYKIGTAGTYAGVACEIGDMIICNTDGTSANNAHWNVIQTNIDGAVIGSASSTDNAIARFDGTTGRIIQNSGITINDNGNLVIAHTASATMTTASTNPQIIFADSGNQPVHLIYSDYDNYRAPAGLKIIGGTNASPAWLEVEGNIYAAAFKGNADTATSAGKWTTARTLTIGNKGQSVDGSGNVSWSLADIGAAPASTISCTTANVQNALGINTSSGSTSKALTEKGTWATFGTSNLTIGTTSTTAMAGNTTVTNVAISANITTDANYPIVFATSNKDTTTAKNEGLQKSGAKFYFNPSTGNVQATTFNGYTLAAASAKGVVTTIDTSANLPTSNAVKTFVEGKGYVTSSGVTSIKLIQGAGITVSSSGTAITTTGERTISITGMDTTNGSTTKWLNQKGGWSTPTAANVGALASSTVVTNVAISADTTINKEYALVFGTTPSDGTSPTAAKTEGLQKNITKFYTNPSTGTLYSTKFCADEHVTLQWNSTDSSLDFVFA